LINLFGENKLTVHCFFSFFLVNSAVDKQCVKRDQKLFASAEANIKKIQASIVKNGEVTDEDRKKINQEFMKLPNGEKLIKKFKEIFPESDNKRRHKGVSRNN
jgi:hypothetical protein